MTKTGHTYNPQETRDAEQKYVEAAGENYPIFDGPIKVEMSFFEDRTYIKIISLPDWGKTKLKGDLDNYVKLAADGLQKAGIIVNDRDVVVMEAFKK